MEHIDVWKENGVLRHICYGTFQNPDKSAVWCIEEADKIYKWDDFPLMSVYLGDVCAWNDYEKSIQEIVSCDRTQGVTKIGWIGNAYTDQRLVRLRMLEIGKTRPDLFDFHSSGTTAFKSLPDLVAKYNVLIDIEVNNYSASMKYLLWSRRPLLIVDRVYKEYFFKHLLPWVHYIPVKSDLSDLIDRTTWVLNPANQDEARIIAENAFEFAKSELTRDACYRRCNEVISRHIEKCHLATEYNNACIIRFKDVK